jgi:hypothetical protein
MTKVTNKKSSWLRCSAWAGVLAPILFVGIFTLEGALRPGYAPVTMYISALSLGPRGWIQVVNFLIFGILLAVFARGTATELPTKGHRQTGSTLLTTIAVLYFVSGPFVMDPTGTPRSQSSIHGTIHGLAGGLVFLLMPITIFVFLRQFRGNLDWQGFIRWTLVLGDIEAITVAVFTLSAKLPDIQAVFSPWQGLIQRAALLPFMLWLLGFAGKILLISQQD